MGAITKRNQGIRHLHKHITHIKLTFDFDRHCREVVTECIDKLPHHNRQIFAFMMTANVRVGCEVDCAAVHPSNRTRVPVPNSARGRSVWRND